MSQQETTKKYDHASSLSRQVERLNKQIVNGLGQSEDSDYGNYLDSIIMGLMTIENFYIHPFKDEEYEDFSKQGVFNMTHREKIRFIMGAQQKLSELLDRRELFFTSFTEEELGSRDKKKGGE